MGSLAQNNQNIRLEFVSFKIMLLENNAVAFLLFMLLRALLLMTLFAVIRLPPSAGDLAVAATAADCLPQPVGVPRCRGELSELQA